MPNRSLSVLLLCLLMWPAHLTPAVALPARQAATESAAAPPPQLLRDIPALQQKITVEATDRPLGDVLARLSPTLKVDLTARREAADQRVTLHLTDQPVYSLMDRLVILLSHDPDRPHGYHWGPLDRPAGARPVFQLWRDSASEAEERDALDYPRREAAVLLRDLRNMAGMTPQERAQYKGEEPHGWDDNADKVYVKAFKSLSDAQIDALLDGEAVPLDPALFAADLAALRQQKRDSMKHEQELAALTHTADPYPNGIPEPPPPAAPPTLTVTRRDQDDDERLPEAFGQYLISINLDGAASEHIVLDTYDTNTNPDPRSLWPTEAAKASGPVVDLTPLLTARTVTTEQRRDVGFTLQALAQAAHITLYQEDFLRRSSQVEQSDPPQYGLQTLKGPLPTLIAAICAHWNYQAQKVGDDYLFWSRTWAQDRAVDVPERLLAEWRRKMEKQGALTLDDYAEVAAALTWPQIRLTFNTAIPGTSFATMVPRTYHALRVVGLLSPAEHAAAFSDAGLPLAAMPPWEQEAFAGTFQKELSDVSGDQLDQAILTVQTPDDSHVYGQRVALKVAAGDQTLLAAGGTVFTPEKRPPSVTQSP
ncbi:MAG: hypothetical protein JO250_00440 [Armatimonadetes bacterium]|nr:hypothetical protein [Armatimonadota bacterium]